MGFGLLFIGYLIAFLLSLNPFAAVTRLIGYAVCLAALIRLHRHNRWFAFTHAVCYPMLLMAAVGAVSEIASRLTDDVPSSLAGAAAMLESGLGGLILIFHVFLLLGIYTIATDTELDSLAHAARRRLALIAGYAALYLLWLLPIPLGTSYRTTVGILIMVMQLLWTVLDLVLIFRCYMWICLEGDEDMQRKPSRFAFVNRFREKIDAHNEKAADEALAYVNAKRAEQSAKHHKPHKKRKKKKR
ncbi:MAG: hypothetical protein IKL84_01050 [Clostridia bacterium]|nr:hypothetical protein [Clostridia bacterium]